MSPPLPEPTAATAATKRKSPSSSSSTPKTIHFTARNPPWTYLKLQLTPQPTPFSSTSSTSTSTTPLDPLTARTYLSAALTQFLGLTGTSIPIDILKISSSPEVSDPKSKSTATATADKTIWVRVPRDDASAVVAALSSWIGGGTGG
ncbi:hypothetical protein BO70DRAFT_322139, partial [Aspergillus heteromorphus CBS 117.55]